MKTLLAFALFCIGFLVGCSDGNDVQVGSQTPNTNRPSIAAGRVDFRKVNGVVQEVKLGDWVEIKGRVAQIVGGTDALVSSENHDDLIYLKNCPNAQGLIDGSHIDCAALGAGIKEYKSVLGANKFGHEVLATASHYKWITN